MQAWREIETRRADGHAMADLLAESPTRDLIAALAGVTARDPVAANLIATELLNRQNRAPYLGAFLVSATLLAATFLFDFLVTSTPFFELSGPFAIALATLNALILLASFMMYLAWRGRIRPPLRRHGRHLRF